jgi:UDP-glucose 4-epimerase
LGKTIAITGVNGYAASVLLPLLESDADVDNIIGIDIRPWKGGYKKVTFVREDIRSERMAEILKDADIVYHLAFVEDEIHKRQQFIDVNINGSKNIFAACVHNNVEKVIYLSSTVVYGFEKSQAAARFSEDDPLSSGNEKNIYRYCAAHVDACATDLFSHYPDIALTIIRSAMLIGANIDNMLEKSLSMKLLPLPSGSNHLQFIHEDDLSKVLYLAYKKDIPGIFNAGADDTVSIRWCFKKVCVNVLPLPEFLATILTGIGFWLRVFPFSGDWLQLLSQNIYARNGTLKAATGWKPAYTSGEALMTYASKMRDRKRQDNLIQAILSWIIKSGRRLKPFLPVLETFKLGRIPGIRRLIPWLNPELNCINYLPINEGLEVENSIMPPQVVHDLIDSTSIHVIMDKCGCRMLRDCKRYTQEVGCLFMGETALKLPHGVCRKVTRVEAHAHADRAIQLGLLPMVGKVRIDNLIYMTPDRNKLLSVCFCCECCCILTSYKHVPGKYLDGIIQPIDGLTIKVTDACIGCGSCLETCAFNAITIIDSRAVHSHQCRGCGRCSLSCPNDAVIISIHNQHFAQEIKDRIRSYVEF